MSTGKAKLRASVVISENGCRVWQKSTRGNGYGQCSHKDHPSRLAPRWAYTLCKGPIPTGFDVRHKCDNPPCVNPKHLLVGTRKQNIQDAIERGRFKLPPRHKNTVAARAVLAAKYERPAFRQAQGQRIRAGLLLNAQGLTCQICGKQYNAEHPRSKYCSKICKTNRRA